MPNRPHRPAPGGGTALRRLPMGALRASLGHMSRFEDAAALLAFLAEHYTDSSAAEVRWAPEDVVAPPPPGTDAFATAAAAGIASC